MHATRAEASQSIAVMERRYECRRVNDGSSVGTGGSTRRGANTSHALGFSPGRSIELGDTFSRASNEAGSENGFELLCDAL